MGGDLSGGPAELTALCSELLRKMRLLDKTYDTVERNLRKGDREAVVHHWGVARSYAEEGLSIALDICSRVPDGLLRPERIRWAEDLLGMARGELDRQISEQGFRAWRLEQLAYLAEQQGRLPLSVPAEETFRRDGPRILPAMLRVACSTVIATLIAAPLGAFAVHEDVLKEVVKAGIATFLGALGVEIATPAISRVEQDPPARTPSALPTTGPLDRPPPHPAAPLTGPFVGPSDLDDEVPNRGELLRLPDSEHPTRRYPSTLEGPGRDRRDIDGPGMDL